MLSESPWSYPCSWCNLTIFLPHSHLVVKICPVLCCYGASRGTRTCRVASLHAHSPVYVHFSGALEAPCSLQTHLNINRKLASRWLSAKGDQNAPICSGLCRTLYPWTKFTKYRQSNVETLAQSEQGLKWPWTNVMLFCFVMYRCAKQGNALKEEFSIISRGSTGVLCALHSKPWVWHIHRAKHVIQTSGQPAIA